MKPEPLTETEARVLYTALHNSWMPVFGYEEFKRAVKKLGVIGGGFCCRDCTNIATRPHRLGGFVCEEHAPPRVKLMQFPLPEEK